MRIEWTLAWRYFKSRRQNPFIHVIRRVSITGVAVGVMALIVILAVMHGFDHDLKERIVGTYAHSVVTADRPFKDESALRTQIQTHSETLQAFSPYVQAEAMLKHQREMTGVILRGANQADEFAVTQIGQNLVRGVYPQNGAQEILIGRILAERLNLTVGEELEIFSPAKHKGLSVKIVGVFSSGLYEYDSHLIYTSLHFGQQVLDLEGAVQGYALRYADPDQALAEKSRLNRALGYPFFVRTWVDMNATLFGALKLERTVMFLILTLIVMVACFNIIGTLTLLVIDKTRDIGILKALGATTAQIRRIFTLNGFFIGVMGTFCGTVLGVGIVGLLAKYPLIQIPSDIYYFERLPVHLRVWDVAVISVAALVLSLLSTLYPAMKGAQLKTIEAIRYRN